MSNVDRYVAVQAVGDGRAVEAFAGVRDLVAPTPLVFNSSEYRYFTVEYTTEGDDIVVHFFVPNSLRGSRRLDVIERWWLNDFATSLSNVAQEHFQATVPRIMARYTPEVASWWFKAQGYGYLLDREAFLRVFFALLEDSLHASVGALPAGSA